MTGNLLVGGVEYVVSNSWFVSETFTAGEVDMSFGGVLLVEDLLNVLETLAVVKLGDFCMTSGKSKTITINIKKRREDCATFNSP